VAVAAAGTVTALFEADIGRDILLSSSMVAFVPPALYLVLSFVLLRGAPLGRRLGWALAACGVNALLALLSGVTLSLTHPMSFEGAMRRALWAFAPGPLIHLVAAPLALLGWRSRIVPLRVNARSDSPPSAHVPALPLESPTPNWDSVMRTSAPSRPAPRVKPGPGIFDRPMREREVDQEPAPVMRAEPAPGAAAAAPTGVTPAPLVAAPPVPMTPPPLVAASPAPPPPPLVAAPSAPPPLPLVAAPSAPPPPPLVAAPSAPPPPPLVAAPPALLPPPSIPAAPPAMTSTPAAVEVPIPAELPAPAAIDEPVIRVSFDRIADQLPPDVFVLPPERLAQSVREPHVIVIPFRLVLPQLGEGAVEIAWTLIDDQFPELALAMPKADVRRRFPGWMLSLPMDEVVRQIPAEVFRVQGPAPDLFDIAQFPAPFKPEPPAPEEAPAPEPPTEPIVAVVTAPPIDPTPVALEPEPVPDEPALGPESEIPAADSTSVPLAAAVSPAPIDAPVTPPPIAAPSAPAVATTDDECETLGRTLALGLVPLGAFEWHARRVAGRPLVSFVPPTLPREPIDELAVGAAPLVERLESGGIEQVTIRTNRLVCVLTPLGTRGCLAATVRRGGAVAMLEMLSTRAGRATRDPHPASRVMPFPAVATAPARVDNGHRAVGEAARVLAPFGPLAMSLAEAEGAAPSVYVFGGQDQAALAGVARAVHEALVTGHDQEGLGRLESVVLRRGRECAVLRPLRVHGGPPALLAAAGEVALVGRAHRAVAEAAALLETR
jgi:hypothetical protein